MINKPHYPPHFPLRVQNTSFFQLNDTYTMRIVQHYAIYDSELYMCVKTLNLFYMTWMGMRFVSNGRD